ncbi:E3 ubiquitin-protein ligase At1g63170-like [Phoenix dactylifera]|uniref:E3 ubiquitin-protein ligase At1g63170-like n=1 Tax=Phoenix dactylifera TaxID=42345 RepID=A0A8B9AMR6_PHODC|nr:E3 ubiquitin-protein ligase At1g63170-like [Phoenix dactylifera]XP_038984605.1 E3 ubiquitin-protein ligase At1g63170-like [Phoenix dactylifera]XP_038984606.1 E3 ubiquitin-protein ligase At1g63170-like [Phoenix dactylifera]
MLMAVPPLELFSEGQTDRHPLLMEQPANINEHEHIIDISRGGSASTSQSHEYDQNDLDEVHFEDWPSTSTPAPVSQTSGVSPTVPSSRNASSTRRSDNYGRRHRSPLNSGLWISIELVVNVSQIIAAIIVLSLSRHEHPKAPLFAWIVGYTAGCVATLPHLYWRYIHRNSQGSEQVSAHSLQSSSRDIRPESNPYTSISVTQPSEGENNHSNAPVSHLGQSILTASPRINALVDRFKMGLDCFFAVWFVVGNVWIFGGRSSSHDAPNLYGLCIVFLTFSCIGYAMPFILCAMICCCLPCIISIMGFREDMSYGRGATSELINALPTYKFKLKRPQNGDENEINSENQVNGGILAAGTDKERTISAEDAVCCICLANYVNNDELRELPCTHYFHMECVDKWLKINALCPLCKSEVGSSTGSSGMDTGYHHGDQRVGNSAEPQQEMQ